MSCTPQTLQHPCSFAELVYLDNNYHESEMMKLHHHTHHEEEEDVFNNTGASFESALVDDSYNHINNMHNSALRNEAAEFSKSTNEVPEQAHKMPLFAYYSLTSDSTESCILCGVALSPKETDLIMALQESKKILKEADFFGVRQCETCSSMQGFSFP